MAFSYPSSLWYPNHVLSLEKTSIFTLLFLLDLNGNLRGSIVGEGFFFKENIFSVLKWAVSAST